MVNITAIVKNIVEQKIQNTSALAETMLEIYLTKGYAELFEDYDKKIREIHENTVKEFYSYRPVRYDRNESLYNIIDTQIYTVAFEYWFDSDRMTSFRGGGSNDGIYELVFKEGYHGGAKSGPEHPMPGVPFGRNWPSFKHWANPTEQSDPPLSKIMEEDEKYYNSVFLPNEEKMIDNVTKQVISAIS